jgi:lipopolysaccharide/colanic/teichoic acid biosynthesis glycosyltransferase
MVRSVKLLAPLVTLLVVVGCAEIHARYVGHYSLLHNDPRLPWLIVLVAVLWTTTYAAGVTETAIGREARLLRSTAAALSAVVVVSVIQLISRRALLPDFDLGMSVVFLIPLLTIIAGIGERSRAHQGTRERVVAVVGEEDAELLRREVTSGAEQPADLVAVVVPKEALPSEGDEMPLETLVKAVRATLLVLGRDAQGSEEIVSQAVHIHSNGVRVRTLSLFYDEWLGKLPITELERIALLFDINEIHRLAYARVKRLLDIVVAAAGTVPLLVAIPMVAILDLFGNRGPLFYSQPRVGKDSRVFVILKFRTMLPHDGPSSWTASDDPRLGAVGRLLRKLHVDELPQVWNVLRRDLSIVGPRPEQPRYVAQLSEQIPFYDVRHLVRPGITGWAQVKYPYGADELDALEKLQYEFYYLRHQSLGLDLRIMGRTLRTIVHRGGR